MVWLWLLPWACDFKPQVGAKSHYKLSLWQSSCNKLGKWPFPITKTHVEMILMHYFLESGLNNQKLANRLIFVTFSPTFPYQGTTRRRCCGLTYWIMEDDQYTIIPPTSRCQLLEYMPSSVVHKTQCPENWCLPWNMCARKFLSGLSLSLCNTVHRWIQQRIIYAMYIRSRQINTVCR